MEVGIECELNSTYGGVDNKLCGWWAANT